MHYGLWFDELERRLAEFDARSERRWAALEQRSERRWGALEQRGAAIDPHSGDLKQSGATVLIVADNWGGLFDEIPAPDSASSDSTSPLPEKEHFSLDGHIVADNWGGEFEEPGRFSEERDYDWTACVAASPPPVMEQLILDTAAIKEIEPEEFPHQIQELEEKLQDANIATLEGRLSKREVAMRALAGPPCLDVVFDPDFFGTASGRVSFRPGLHHSDAPKFGSELCVFEPPAFLAYADAARAEAQHHFRSPYVKDVGADDPVDPGPNSELHGATHCGGGRAIPRLVIRLRMRARRTKTARRRRPLRRRLWRPLWRLTSYRRCPRRHGHRIGSCALRPDTEAGDALLPRRLTERSDRNRFLHGGTLQLVEFHILDHAAVRCVLRVRDDMLLIVSEALAEQATKEYLAKTYELVLACHLPLPDVFDKDAESCMYTPTDCSTQVLNSNDFRLLDIHMLITCCTWWHKNCSWVEDECYRSSL